jgi:hypothetical protein
MRARLAACNNPDGTTIRISFGWEEAARKSRVFAVLAMRDGYRRFTYAVQYLVGRKRDIHIADIASCL